ncbi:MAG: hypothetical protein P4N59_07465 [Negativicutes bacterium]|nr:hypothetical protein [Negativicutes bacterium]
MKYVGPDGYEYTLDELNNLQTTPAQPQGATNPQALATAYGAFSTQNADDAGRLAESARILGIDPAQMTGASKEVMQAAALTAKQKQNSPEDWQQFTEQYPATTSFLSKRENMAVAHDDIGNLSETEGVLSGIGRAISNQSRLNELTSQRNDIVMRMALAGGGPETLDEDMRANLVKLNNNIAQTQSQIPQQIYTPSGLAATLTSFAPYFRSAAKYGSAGMLTGAGIGAVLGEGVGAVPGAAFGLGLGMKHGFGVEAANNSFAQTYLANLENGVNPTAAKVGALAAATGNYVFNVGMLGKYLETIPGGTEMFKDFTSTAGADALKDAASTTAAWKDYLKNIAITSAETGAFGAGMEAANVTGENIGSLLSHKPTVSNDEAWQRISTSAEDMAAMGGVFSLPGHTMSMVGRLNSLASESKLLKRSPAAFEQHLDEVTKGTPVETMYINPDALTEYFQTALPDKPDKVKEIYDKLGVSDQLQQAMRTGDDVAISTAKFETALGGTKYADDLAQHVKFNEGDLTAGEITKAATEREAAMKEAAKTGEPAAEPVTEQKPAGTFDSWQQKLTDAGLNKTQANQYAAMFDAYSNTLEARTGGLVKAEDLAKSVGIERQQGVVGKVKQFLQSLTGTERGSFTPNETEPGGLIKLFQNKDNSTVIHESGHMFLDNMDKLTKAEGISEEMKADYQTVRNFLGTKDGEAITTEQHEKFAKAFEAYMRDGKAPSTGLKRAFEKFKTWLTSIYSRIADLGVEVSPEVKGVFDRLLATDEEIKQAESFQNYSKDYSRLNFKQYLALKDKAHEEAVNSVLRKKMQELDPEVQKRLDEATAQATVDIKTEVSESPLYRAMAEIERNNGGKSSKLLAQEFLDKTLNHDQTVWFDMLAKRYGFSDAKTLARQISKGRLPENEIAHQIEAFRKNWVRDELGLGHEFDTAVQAIHNEHQAEAIALEFEMLRQMAQDKYGTTKEEAYNRRWADAEAWSEQQKARIARQGEISFKVARETARDMLETKPLFRSGTDSKGTPKMLNWRRYMDLERKNRDESEKLLNKGDYEGALKAKTRELLNHLMAIEAVKAEREYNSTMRNLDRYINRGNRLMGIPVEFMSQIESLLKNTGMIDRSPILPEGQFDVAPLRTFIDNRVANDYGYSAIPSSILDGAVKQFKDMSLNDLRDFKAAVSSLNTIGRNINRFIAKEQKEGIQQAASNFRGNVIEKVGTPKAEDKGIGRPHKTAWEKVSLLPSKLVDAPSKLVTVENICRVLDGGEENGPAQRYIFRPMYEAWLDADGRARQTTKDIIELMGKHDLDITEVGKMFDDDRQFPEIPGRDLSMGNVLMMALNWGNEGNRDRIRRGYFLEEGAKLTDVDAKLIDSRVMKVLGELDSRHLGFAQDVLNYLESYWPEIRQHEMDITGVDPRKVEATPYTITAKDGKEVKMDGGYYPIAYDPDKSVEAFKSQEQLNALYKNFPTTKAMTDHGHTEARASKVTRPVWLEFRTLTDHLSNFTYDLAMRKAVIDTSRFLRATDSKAAITDALGLKYYNIVDNWLKDLATDQRKPYEFGQEIFNNIRGATTKYILGINVKALPDFLPVNIMQSLWQAGVQPTASAMVDAVLHPKEAYGDSWNNSEMMRNRLHLVDKNIAEFSKGVLGSGWLSRHVPGGGELAAGKAVFDSWSMSVHGMVDCMLSLPVWKQIYEKSMSEGKSEADAAYEADSMIRRTFGDGAAPSLPAVFRESSQAYKLMTMFLTWQMGMFNRLWYASKMADLEYTKGNYATGMGIMTKAIVMGWILPSLWSATVRVGIPGIAGAGILATGITNTKKPLTDEDKTKEIAKEIAKAPINGVPILNGLSDYALSTVLHLHGEYRLSPIEGTVADIGKEAKQVGDYYLGSGPHLPNAQDKANESAVKLGLLAAGLPKRLDMWTFNALDWVNHNGDRSTDQAFRDFFSREK